MGLIPFLSPISIVQQNDFPNRGASICLDKGLFRRFGEARGGEQRRRANRLQALRRRRAKDGRKLSRSVHGRKGLWLRRIILSPRHHRFHGTGRRLYQPQRHWQKVYLWTNVSRLKL